MARNISKESLEKKIAKTESNTKRRVIESNRRK